LDPVLRVRDIGAALRPACSPIDRHAYVHENGRIVMQGRGSDLLRDERLKTAYLGM
jgi:ABC-type branched-subunit amino acid transport system ATPase component